MKKILFLMLTFAIAWGAVAQDNNKKYEIRSGIAKTVTEDGSQTTDGVFYFDSYGANEALLTVMDVPELVTVEYRTVTQGKRAWFVTDDGSKKRAKEFVNPIWDLNFLQLTDAVVEKYKIQKVGQEEYMGKMCTKYTYETTQGRRKASVTAWVYKGFTLKSLTLFGRKKIHMKVTEFQENVPVSASVFEIPGA